MRVDGQQMDRASILGDAIEYLKELLQRINDIHKELEAAKLEQSRSMPTSPVGGRTLRSTQGFSAAVKEECPVLPNPESQPPRVRVTHHPLSDSLIAMNLKGLLFCI